MFIKTILNWLKSIKCKASATCCKCSCDTDVNDPASLSVQDAIPSSPDLDRFVGFSEKIEV